MTNTMNYKEFKTYISDHIRQFLPEDFKCERVFISQVCKSSDETLDALFIEEEGSIAAPNIYLEEYYAKYASGTRTEELMKEIADFRICFRNPESVGLDPLICNPSAPDNAFSQITPTCPSTSWACSQAIGSSSMTNTHSSWGSRTFSSSSMFL